MSLRICPLAILLVLSFASASQSLAADPELKKLQGEWVTKMETDGGEKKVTLSIDGNKIRFAGEGVAEWYEGTFELDSKAKPKRISVLIEDCPFDQYKKKTSEGIYSLDGKRLTVCATEPGAPEGPSGWDDEKARTLTFVKE